MQNVNIALERYGALARVDLISLFERIRVFCEADYFRRTPPSISVILGVRTSRSPQPQALTTTQFQGGKHSVIQSKQVLLQSHTSYICLCASNAPSFFFINPSLLPHRWTSSSPSPNFTMSASTEARELDLVGKVEMRIALAKDDKLESMLKIYLPPLLLKLGSDHLPVRNKVIFVLSKTS